MHTALFSDYRRSRWLDVWLQSLVAAGRGCPGDRLCRDRGHQLHQGRRRCSARRVRCGVGRRLQPHSALRVPVAGKQARRDGDSEADTHM